MTLKALEFIIGAEFGIFRKPDSQDLGLTFSFIPKSAVLGVCGAIIGLGGYKEGSKIPEFLSKLSDFKIGVAPYENGRPAEKPFRKIFVKFTNYHGYGNADGPLICTEQLLVEPAYKVTVIADEDNHNFTDLYNKLKHEKTEFRPYLGKNEFLANMQFTGIYDARQCTDEIVSCTTIYPVTSYKKPLRGSVLEIGTVQIDDDYAYLLNAEGQYMRKLFRFTNSQIHREEANAEIGKFYHIADSHVVFAF